MSAQTPPIKRDIYRQRTCLNRRIYTCKVRNSTISFTALSDSCELLGILDAGGYITLQDPCPVQLSVRAPLRPICKAILHWLFILRSSLVILNTLFLLSRMTRAHTTLTAWANTVAMAAPAA